MRDLSHLAGGPAETREIFKGAGTTASTAWIPWPKPRGARVIGLWLIGGGGSGGAGFTGTTANIRNGGGGGGGGASARYLYDARVLPDVLYVSAGAGALATTLAGGAGQPSMVSLDATTAASKLVGIAQAGAGGGIGTSSTTANPSGGAGGAVSVTTNSIIATLALTAFQVGTSGANAVLNAGVGANSTAYQGNICCGGAGGGGAGAGIPPTTSQNAGGGIVAGGPIGTILGGTAGSSTVDSPVASGGQEIQNPFASCGGAGGGGNSSPSRIGGPGGFGGFPGSGGGGGGGAVTGGRGGGGGPGMVMIEVW